MPTFDVKERQIANPSLPPIVYSEEELYDKYSPALYYIVTSIIPDKRQAEETLVEIFVYLYKHSSDFNPQRNSFAVWLMNTARNIAIDNLCNTQQVYNCDENLKSLPLSEKTVFALFHFRAYTINQTADVLHLSVPLVQKLLQQAEAKTNKII